MCTVYNFLHVFQRIKLSARPCYNLLFHSKAPRATDLEAYSDLSVVMETASQTWTARRIILLYRTGPKKCIMLCY